MLQRLAFGDRWAAWRFRLALLIYAAIPILGNIPGARQDIGHLASGVVLHGTAYAVITFLLFTGMRLPYATRALTALLIVAGMGALDEYVQSFFWWRGASVGDWLVDCAASLLTSAMLVLVFPPLRDLAERRPGPGASAR